MTTTGPQMPPPSPLTPPTDAGAIPPKRSAWPMVIGVIAIIFGSLATLQGCMGLGWPALAISASARLHSFPHKPRSPFTTPQSRRAGFFFRR